MKKDKTVRKTLCRSRGVGVKYLVLLLALVLSIGGVVGGSLAWLTAKSEPVTNTFAPSTIKITLSEEAQKPDYKFKMVPGDILAKNPKVKVEAGSEACWLFIAITESANLDNFITYDVADGWTQLTGYENIYYREISVEDINKGFNILQGNDKYTDGCVTVRNTVTETMMEGIESSANMPTLKFDACAVQRAHIETIEAAWEKIPDEFEILAKKVINPAS